MSLCVVGDGYSCGGVNVYILRCTSRIERTSNTRERRAYTIIQIPTRGREILNLEDKNPNNLEV